MNIYELEKQATPGPLVVKGIADRRMSTDATLVAFTPKHNNPRYVARVYGEGVMSNLCAERDANAKLLAHCRNNFVRAVEALKQISKETVNGQQSLAASVALGILPELEELE